MGVSVAPVVVATGVSVTDEGRVAVALGNVEIGVGETVPGPGVADGTTVPGVTVGTSVGVEVGCTTGAFNNGLYRPTVTPLRVKVVLFQNQLYFTNQPAKVAPIIVGRSIKCRCGTFGSTLPGQYLIRTPSAIIPRR